MKNQSGVLFNALCVLAVVVFGMGELVAQVNIPVSESNLTNESVYYDFSIDFGATPTTTTVTASVTFTPDAQGSILVRLFDVDGLIDDPESFENGTFIDSDGSSVAGIVTATLASPSLTGVRHYVLEVSGSVASGNSWDFSGAITTPNLTGTLGGTDTLEDSQESVAVVGSFIRWRADFGSTKSVRTRLTLNAGASSAPLRYITSLNGTAIGKVEYAGPADFFASNFEDVTDVFENALADDGLVAIDELNFGGDVDQSRYFESTENVDGTIDLEVRVSRKIHSLFEDVEGSSIDVVMFFSGEQPIVDFETPDSTGGSSVVIGDGLASCSLSKMRGMLLPWVVLALMVLGVVVRRLSPRG